MTKIYSAGADNQADGEAMTLGVGAVVQERSLPTIAQAKTFARAILTGKYVAREVVAQRLEICRRCEKRRITQAGVEWCGMCGCKVGRKDRELDNLAAYEEKLPKWGCKHPLRGEGRGWPLAIVVNGEGATADR